MTNSALSTFSRPTNDDPFLRVRVRRRKKAPQVQAAPESSGSAALYSGYAALGAGAIAAGVGAYFGSQAKEFDALERGATGTSQLEAASIQDDSDAAASIANASFIAAGAFGAAGLGLILYHYLSTEEPTLELAPNSDGMTLWLRGSF